MEKVSIPLSFSHNGVDYTGWATPSDHLHPDGRPSSFHVVLNENFFGEMSFDNGHWMISERRPKDLVMATADELAKNVP